MINDNTLKIKLGEWVSKNNTRSHNAYFQSTKRALWLRHKEVSWTKHTLINQGRRTKIFSRQIEITTDALPTETKPYQCISQTNQTYITGRETNAIKQQTTGQDNTSLSRRIQHRSSETLLRNVDLTMEEEDIFKILLQKTYIDMATDGSYDPVSGISSYGWVVTLNDSVLAKGKGPAEGHPELADPMHAETYGLTSGALFITILIHHYNIVPEDHIWMIHLDNTNLIKQMEMIQQESTRSKWNFTPHADILKMAHKFLRKIPITYSHVKAHQDKSENKNKLSRAASLNIMADTLAQSQRQEMKKVIWMVSTDHIHLLINNITITKECQQWLLETSSQIPIQQYYQAKYNWRNNTFHKINWKAQHKVLRRFDNNDQCRILKFCHGWLPTNERLHREQQATTSRCSLCHHLQENNIHLFTCKHPGQQDIIQSLFKRIENDNTNYGVDEMVDLVKMAIQNLGTPWSHTTEDGTLKQCIQDQTDIGWDNLLLGRLPKSIASYIDRTLQQRGVEKWQNSGERWTQRFIQNIWETFLRLWRNRNTLIYDDQTKNKHELLREKLKLQVERCYQYAKNW